MDDKVGQVIQAVMLEARRRAGTADRLLAKMDPATRRSKSAISAYINGDSPPPADVFLEAARVMKVHVDEYLYGASFAEQLDRMKAELEELKRERPRGPSTRP